MADENDDVREVSVNVSGLEFLSKQGTSQMKTFMDALQSINKTMETFASKDFLSSIQTTAKAIQDLADQNTRLQQTLANQSAQSQLAQQAVAIPPSIPQSNQGTINQLARVANPQLSLFPESSSAGQLSMFGLPNDVSSITATTAKKAQYDLDAQQSLFTGTPSNEDQLSIFGGISNDVSQISSTEETAQEAQETAQEAQDPNLPQRFLGYLNKRLTRAHGVSMQGGLYSVLNPAGGAGSPSNPVDPDAPSPSTWDLSKLFAKNVGNEIVTGGLVGGLLDAGFQGVNKLKEGAKDVLGAPLGLAGFYSSQSQGAALGYQRGADIGPFSSPFSPATGEGERQKFDVLKLASQGGINLGQAQQIEQASANYGFSGQFGSQVTDQLLGPLFQKFGADPSQILQNFGEGLRTGVVTVGQLNGALQNLGSAAQTASMTLTDTSNAVAQAMQNIQSIGGTEQQGIDFGLRFQGLTGLPASVGGQLVTNPLVQSIIASQTGVMPSLQGTLNSTILEGGIGSTVQLLSKLYDPAFATKTQQIRDPLSGQLEYTYTDSGQSQANALIAKQLGLDVGEVQRLQKYGKATQEGDVLQGALGKYYNQSGPNVPISPEAIQRLIEAHGITTRTDTRYGQVTNRQNYPNLSAGSISNINQQAGTFQLTANGQTQTLPLSSLQIGSQSLQGMSANKIAEELASYQTARGQAGGSTVYWNQIQNEIRKSGLWQGGGKTQAEINRLNKIANPRDRAQTAKQDISKQLQNAYQGQGGGGPTIAIDLSPAAKKALKVTKTGDWSQLNANSGTGPTMNYAIAQPQGTTPLGYGVYDQGDNDPDSNPNETYGGY